MSLIEDQGNAESSSWVKEPMGFLGTAWFQHPWLANTAASCDVYTL